MCVKAREVGGKFKYRSRKGTSDSPEAELQKAVSSLMWVLGTEFGSPGRVGVHSIWEPTL